MSDMARVSPCQKIASQLSRGAGHWPMYKIHPSPDFGYEIRLPSHQCDMNSIAYQITGTKVLDSILVRRYFRGFDCKITDVFFDVLAMYRRHSAQDAIHSSLQNKYGLCDPYRKKKHLGGPRLAHINHTWPVGTATISSKAIDSLMHSPNADKCLPFVLVKILRKSTACPRWYSDVIQTAWSPQRHLYLYTPLILSTRLPIPL